MRATKVHAQGVPMKKNPFPNVLPPVPAVRQRRARMCLVVPDCFHDSKGSAASPPCFRPRPPPVPALRQRRARMCLVVPDCFHDSKGSAASPAFFRPRPSPVQSLQRCIAPPHRWTYWDTKGASALETVLSPCSTACAPRDACCSFQRLCLRGTGTACSQGHLACGPS